MPTYQNPGLVEPAGPADQDVSILSVRERDGWPIALLAESFRTKLLSDGSGELSYGDRPSKMNELLGGLTDAQAGVILLG